ncbi:MAG: hypothetical protein JNL51_15985 [Chitinophagaceae bacterium]|nr:hypothetical protein [Chitinophagaceae bacterium]
MYQAKKELPFKISFALVVFLMINSISTYAQSGKTRDLGVVDIGSQRQLFVDDFLKTKFTGGAALRLHHPAIQEISLVHDEPWEGSFSNYNSIFKDGEIYRMYYRGWGRGPKGEITHPMVWCYAESKDGIHWEKPNLGLFEFNGSKENNIVLASRDFGNFQFTLYDNVTVFKDLNPNAPPDALYKALVDSRKPPIFSLYAFKSPDGIHWSPLSENPILTNGAFDSQNTAFWDSKRKEYRIYWRFFKNKIRAIRTATSKDFIHWENESDVEYKDTMTQQLYTNGIIPYYRAPQIYIGFPARYIDRGWSSSMYALPELEERKMRGTTNPRFSTALTGSIFMASTDGVKFKRWNDAFLRPGIERNGTWNYSQQYIGWSILETKSNLEGAPNELSIYANESLWTSNSSALRRYTLRLDGFVSVNAPMDGGGFITRPFRFKGKKLSLNFSTSAYGTILVEIQDLKGKPIPGFSLEDCSPIFGDTIDRPVTWKSGSDLSAIEGKSVRLHVEMKDADLYSFRFDD